MRDATGARALNAPSIETFLRCWADKALRKAKGPGGGSMAQGITSERARRAAR